MTDPELEAMRRELTEHKADTNRRFSDVGDAIDQLRASDREIMDRLAQSATHEDVLTLHTKIDSSINGLLRDALDAIPKHAAIAQARWLNVWSALAVVVGASSLLVAILMHHG